MPLSETTPSSPTELNGDEASLKMPPQDQLFAPREISGDPYAHSVESSGQRATGRSAQGLASVGRQEGAHGIKLVFRSCREAIERALENQEDVINRANALNDLRDALDALWEYRNTREQQFADFINHIQGLLIEVEDLPIEQIQAIGHVIEKASYATRLTDADLREYTTILMRAGCDVFREIR